MKKLMLCIVLLGSWACGLAQDEMYVGQMPLRDLEAHYLIVDPYVFGTTRQARVDFGQNCSEYEGMFEIGKRRRFCDGLNTPQGDPAQLNSLAHMINIFAELGYELDRILSDHAQQAPFDPWEAQYIFRRK